MNKLSAISEIAADPSGERTRALNKIQCDAGELTEIPVRRPRRRLFSVDERRSIYGQIRYYAQHQGYRRGWVKHRFFAFTGIYPDGVENADPVPPSPMIMDWIKTSKFLFARKN